MSASTDDEYYMGIAMAVRERANCTGNRVGAILVREGRIIASGYNCVPEGMKSCMYGGCMRCSRSDEFPSGTGYDLCICTHAEGNCLLSAARFGIAVEGATLYATMEPCYTCCKEMLNAYVKHVVFLHPWTPTDEDPKWAKEKKAEYEKLLRQFKEVRRVSMPDAKEKWAVRSKRESEQKT